MKWKREKKNVLKESEMQEKNNDYEQWQQHRMVVYKNYNNPSSISKI